MFKTRSFSNRTLIIALSLVLFCAFALTGTPALAKDKFKVDWSHYTGWEFWPLADHMGILKKHADKQGIEIELVLINDYINSINFYTAGDYDACVMTNMDALTIPAVGGVDSTALIIGDYSNGNDGFVVKNFTTIDALKGREIKLVELSVSHYLFARWLDVNKLKEKQFKLMNTGDANIAAAFLSDPNGAVVTWNPQLMDCKTAGGAKMLFDSSQTPGEIIDMMVVKTGAPDSLKKALAGAWYETMGLMKRGSKDRKKAIEIMADSANATVPMFKAQLKTTKMYYNARDAVAFAKSDQLKETMAYVRMFSFSRGLYGDADSADYVGIVFPDGSVLGDKGNVKLRFDATYMQLAADGML